MENILIVGNPNSGKTTLFNKLTKSKERTGNFSGVTVDLKEKIVALNDKNYNVIDLPGIFSLSPNSLEEKVSSEQLYKYRETDNSYVLNVCDANALKRSLVLTTQLVEAGFKVAMLINNMQNTTLPDSVINNIKEKFGINVFVLNVKKDGDLNKLFDTSVYSKVKHLNYIDKYKCEGIDNFFSIKLCEKDEYIREHLSKSQVDCAIKDLKQKNLNIDTILNDRLNLINEICSTNIVNEKKHRIDNILLNKYLAFPMFLLIMLGIFYLTFASFGEFLSNLLNDLICGKFYTFIQESLTNVGANEFFADFILNAVITGLGTLICFLPQIVLLFVFISILEGSGYLPRLAFLFDDIFEKFGLSGKSLFTFIMSFGCCTTAMLTAKNQDNERQKVKTMILSQYMSCSAKLPIFTTLCSAFFTGNVLVIFGAYLLGVLIALIVALILQNSKLKTESKSFILEMPSYFSIDFKNMLYVAYKNSKEFLIRVGGIVLLFMAVVWLLQTLSTSFTFTKNKEDSLLYFIGNLIAPIFAPLGFGSFGPCIALIVGLVAKELIVSTISMLNFNELTTITLTASLALPTSVVHFTTASALSFLVFVLLYSPCISSMSVMKKEIGAKYTLVAILIQFVSAYIVALLVYALASFISSSVLVMLLIAVLLCICLILCLKSDKCLKCANCSGNCTMCNKK